MPVRSKYPPHVEKALKDKSVFIYDIARDTGISIPTVRKILLGQQLEHKTACYNQYRETAKNRIADYLGIPLQKL